METKQTASHGHLVDDNITKISTLADNPFFKLKPTGTIYKQIQPNIRQSGRGTVCVPMTSFNGVSENAGFSSKLKFFDEGAKRNQNKIIKKVTLDFQKGKIEDKKISSINFQENKNDIKSHIDNIKENEDVKKMQAILELNKKRLSLGDVDLSQNLKIFQNMNAINDITIDKKTKQNNNISSNSNNNNNEKTQIKTPKDSNNNIKEKKNNSNKETPIPNSNDKNEKSINTNNSSNINSNILEEHWKDEEILLNYNILDFTSKYIF